MIAPEPDFPDLSRSRRWWARGAFAAAFAAVVILKVGQSIDWHLPGGKSTRLRVLEVIDQPEARSR